MKLLFQCSIHAWGCYKLLATGVFLLEKKVLAAQNRFCSGFGYSFIHSSPGIGRTWYNIISIRTVSANCLENLICLHIFTFYTLERPKQAENQILPVCSTKILKTCFCRKLVHRQQWNLFFTVLYVREMVMGYSKLSFTFFK